MFHCCQCCKIQLLVCSGPRISKALSQSQSHLIDIWVCGWILYCDCSNESILSCGTVYCGLQDGSIWVCGWNPLVRIILMKAIWEKFFPAFLLLLLLIFNIIVENWILIHFHFWPWPAIGCEGAERVEFSCTI